MSILITIIDGPLPRDARDPEFAGAGAVLRFDGIVRADEAGRPIAALDYSAYEPMASRVMSALAHEVVARHGLLSLIAEHSRGRVAVGECAFRLRVAALHRREGLLAMGEFIDQMKRDVPIWKAPVFEMHATPCAAAAPPRVAASVAGGATRESR